MSDNAAYHADTSATSHSMLETFRRSPALYDALYVSKRLAKPEPTPSMMLGSAVHCLALEPDKWPLEYAVAPKVDRRTKDGKLAWECFCLEAEGKAVIDQDTACKVDRIASSLGRSEIFASLMDMPGRVIEEAAYWTDDATELALKMKPDLYCPAGATDFALCVDLKTASDPSPDAFARQAANLGYHRQAAFYLDGCRHVCDDDTPVKFLFIVVGNDEPYDVWPYLMGEEWIDVGNVENWQALARLKQCFETGVWLAPEQTQLTALPMPAWLGRRN